MTAISKQRLIWPDALKVFACFFVVCLHSSALALGAIEPTRSKQDSVNWWLIALLNCFCRFGVPVFLMITGIFLLDPKREITGKRLRSYIFKIAVVIVVTSLFWTAIKVLFDLPKQEVTLNSAIRLTLATPYHMWYLWALLGMYLIAPILRQLAKNRSVLQYTLGVICFVVFTKGLIENLGDEGINILSPDLVWLTDLLDSKMSYTLAATFPCLYVLAGYWLSDSELKKLHRRLIYLFGVLSFAVIFLFARQASKTYGQFSVGLGNESIFVALFAVAVFVLFMNKKRFGSVTLDVVNYVSPTLLWTYAIHAVILELLRVVTPLNDFYRGTGFVGTAGVSVVVFWASVFLARGIERAKSMIRSKA